MTDDLVAAIAGHPDLARRLLAEHVDDGRGRCTRCTLGAQAGHQRWPCTLRVLAVAACSTPAVHRTR